jgi:hypothetical protein
MRNDNDELLDEFTYSFSNLVHKYDMLVDIAAKCDGPAHCHVFPRSYQSTLQDKTSAYGYNKDEATFIVAQCKVEPLKVLGSNCIMFCQSE